MRDLLADARKSFDYIVVDLPPLGPVIDVKAFAPLADGLVLVTAWGATPRALVRSILNAEPLVAAKILGIVLNKTDMKKLARYGSFGGAEQYFDLYASYYLDQPAAQAKPARLETCLTRTARASGVLGAANCFAWRDLPCFLARYGLCPNLDRSLGWRNRSGRKPVR